MTDAVTFKKLPGVVALQRCMLNSDATFYDEIDGQLVPLSVIRHGIRGTQNFKEKKDAAGSAKAAPRAVALPQVTESAKTDTNAAALVVKFDLRLLDLGKALFSCSSSAKAGTPGLVPAFRVALDDFVQRAKSSAGLQDVARRIARNVVNGRWLWRNRVIAETITVTVKHNGVVLGAFDALSIPMNDFDVFSEGECAVADVLAQGLCGRRDAVLSVSARVTFGVQGAVEVFPSQNFVEKRTGYARSLYKLGHAEPASVLDVVKTGHAAMRDQKIGNALRTIDTWYPTYADVLRPIPVEPNGASLDLDDFMRVKNASAFVLFRSLAHLDPASDDGKYCIAALIRGGVYSDSDKSAAAKNAKAEEAAQESGDSDEEGGEQ